MLLLTHRQIQHLLPSLSKPAALLDKGARAPIQQTVNQADAAARMPNRLLEPDNGLGVASTLVPGLICVFGFAGAVPGWCQRQDYEQGVHRTWDVGEQRGLAEGVDVVEGEGFGEA
jgi:hypothetical protein